MITRRLLSLISAAVILVTLTVTAFAQTSNVTVRVMAANLNGDTQSYQPFALRIFQGLNPDVVAIQEFNYSNNTPTDFRSMVDTAFGTNFVYYREPFTANGDIPNGIISRYPILSSGSWADTVQTQPNRGFAWAQIGLPGSNSLYVVSVHLLTSSAANRGAEAANLKTLMQANFPANAWIVLAGDFNAGTRTEACITTFSGYLTDSPIPVDDLGNSDTSANRNSPHDYVLPSITFTNVETPTLFPTLSYPKGLVFDSRVYTNASALTSNFTPVLLADSGNAQHMAVMKDFKITITNGVTTNAPSIVTQPQGNTNNVGTAANFFVAASGTAPLAYQWRLNSTNLSGATATNYSIASAQTTNDGDYTVIITNIAGSVTSSVATLTVTVPPSNTPPVITSNPTSQTNAIGTPVEFTVAATGTAPLVYQWQLNGTNLSGANATNYDIASVQSTNAGNYTVIITNIAGKATSDVATLTVSLTNLPPNITINPGNQTNVVGTTATFSVSATGTSPLSYQWLFNGTTISSATNGSYVKSNVQTNDAGPYVVVITNIAGAVTSTPALLTVVPVSTNTFTGVLVGWNMTGVTNFGPSPMAPTTNAPNLSFVGLTRGLGVTTSPSAAANAWGGNGFGSTNSADAISAGDFATLSVTAVAGFNVSFGSVSAFNYRRSGTAPPSGLLQFQVGSGAFTDITNVAYTSTATTGASLSPIDLSTIAALQNIGPGTNVTFRLVNYGTNITGGNWYIYDVGSSAALDFAISGSVTPAVAPSGPPATAPMLSTPSLVGSQIVFQLTGTVSSNYVVLGSTNLSNWLPLQTNPAPFWFTNPVAQPQQYFRGAVAP